jgi:hypothetical protein
MNPSPSLRLRQSNNQNPNNTTNKKTDQNPLPHTGRRMRDREVASGTGNKKTPTEPLNIIDTLPRTRTASTNLDSMPARITTAPSTLALVPKEEEIQGQEKPGRETGQKGEEKEATHTTTGKKGQEKILTRGINPGGILERIRDSKKEPRTNETNNLLTELLAMQAQRLHLPRPSSAELTGRLVGTEVMKTGTPPTPTMISMTATTGTEGPRESATMTTKKKTP